MAEQLALRNQEALIRSAQEKLSEGKRLTRAEISAVAKAEQAKAKAHDWQFLQAMPKHAYIAEFGGAERTYLDWHDRWGFPWPRGADTVDGREIMRWMRDFIARNGERPPDQPRAPASTSAERIAEAKAEMYETQLAKMRGSLVALEDVKKDQQAVAAAVRAGIEKLCGSCGEWFVENVIGVLSEAWGIDDLSGENEDRPRGLGSGAAAPATVDDSLAEIDPPGVG